MGDITRLPDSRDVTRKRDPAATREPWLVSVSPDLTRWEFRDVGVPNPKSSRLNLERDLADGSRLTDAQNRDLFETCVEYIQILRLHKPDITAENHLQRVRALLAFFYWLSQQGIRTFDALTADHIEVYTRESIFGLEYLVRAPHQLIAYLRGLLARGEHPPTDGSYRYRVDRKEAFRAAGVPRFLSGARLCGPILAWFEESKFKGDLSGSVEEILSRAGCELRLMTVDHLHSGLLPLEELYLWRTQFSSPTFAFNPFSRGSHQTAAAFGRPKGRTKTIPPPVGISMLGHALTWVMVYAPPILTAVSKGTAPAGLQRLLSRRGCQINVVSSRNTPPKFTRTFTVDGVIMLLATACFVVIAVLSARRRSEILDFSPGCCTKDEFGDYWLHTYIAKTLRRYEDIPVPAAVHQAVSIMETLSASARAASEGHSIWRLSRRATGAVSQFEPLKWLDAFASLSDDERIRDWHFTPHQFRRFFATLYFWWYDDGDIGSLGHHLRHLDIEMTKRYVMGMDYGEQFRHAHDEWREALVRQQVSGSRRFGGKAGLRLTRLVRKLHMRFRKDAVVVAREKVVQYVLDLGTRLGVPFRLHVWGTVCACPSLRLFARHAACKGAAEIGPNWDNATETQCGSCPFAIHTENFSPHAEAALAKRQALRTVSAGTLLETFANSECVQLEDLIAKGDALPSAMPVDRIE